MYYFASDVHLGGGGREEARRVERLFVAWLERAGRDAKAIVLAGDIFDMWFEYKRSVPKGFTRALGAISSLTDRGVRVIFIAGNHDMWVGDYLSQECGVELYTKPHTFDFGGRLVHVAHGDNINVRGDVKLKIINKIFRSKAIYNITRRLVHPDPLLKFGQWWSEASRHKHREMSGHNTIKGSGVAPLLEYVEVCQEERERDYYLFGHLHQRLTHKMGEATIFFINDWSEEPHFALLNGEGEMTLNKI